MANPVLNQIFVSSPYRPRHHCELFWMLNFPSKFSKVIKISQIGGFMMTKRTLYVMYNEIKLLKCKCF